jgi:hypothetical protein
VCDVLVKQLQCCGINDYTDYQRAGNDIWHARNPSALAPMSCCQPSISSDSSYPANGLIQDCVNYGNATYYYYQQV